MWSLHSYNWKYGLPVVITILPGFENMPFLSFEKVIA